MARSDEGPAWIKVRGVEIGWNGEERGDREVVAPIAGMKQVKP